jgi:hypothetical protein
MMQLFFKNSLEWLMDNHIKDSKNPPYINSDYLSLEFFHSWNHIFSWHAMTKIPIVKKIQFWPFF